MAKPRRVYDDPPALADHLRSLDRAKLEKFLRLLCGFLDGLAELGLDTQDGADAFLRLAAKHGIDRGEYADVAYELVMLPEMKAAIARSSKNSSSARKKRQPRLPEREVLQRELARAVGPSPSRRERAAAVKKLAEDYDVVPAAVYKVLRRR